MFTTAKFSTSGQGITIGAQVTSAAHPVSCKLESEVNTKVRDPLGSEDVNVSPTDSKLLGSLGCPPSPLSSPQSVCARTGKVVSGPL